MLHDSVRTRDVEVSMAVIPTDSIRRRAILAEDGLDHATSLSFAYVVAHDDEPISNSSAHDGNPFVVADQRRLAAVFSRAPALRRPPEA